MVPPLDKAERKGKGDRREGKGNGKCGMERKGKEKDSKEECKGGKEKTVRKEERLAFLPKVLSQYESFPVQHFQLHT